MLQCLLQFAQLVKQQLLLLLLTQLFQLHQTSPIQCHGQLLRQGVQKIEIGRTDLQPFFTPFEIEKAERLLGWRPTVSLEEGLGRTADYLRSKLSQYRAQDYVV